MQDFALSITSTGTTSTVLHREFSIEHLTHVAYSTIFNYSSNVPGGNLKISGREESMLLIL